jgi:hypothetical protein
MARFTSNVQFCGIDDLMKAYNNRGIEIWAVCQGKEIISCGDGSEELKEFIDLLSKTLNNNVYTLRIYSTVSNPDSITNKTEYNGSFKFMLECAAVGGGMQRVESGNTGSATDLIAKKINERIGAVVDKELDKIFSGEVGQVEEKETGLWGVLKPYIDTPDKLVATIGAIKQMFGAERSATALPAMAAIGNVQPDRIGRVPVVDENGLVDSLSPEMLERLGVALDRLGKCDSLIVEHLEGLATIAETKPDVYKMALNFLK